MDILLIAPASGPWRGLGKRRVFNGRTFRFSMLSLLTVAELSPRDARVRIVDEQIDAVSDEDYDVVGITAMTALAPRAYELCDRFRARGIPVVMGGYHATLNPEDALEHADAVVVGPAYGAWEAVCEDVRAGTLQRRYDGDPAARHPVHLPRRLLSDSEYVSVSSTFATSGCRNRCGFCSITKFYGARQFARPTTDVVAELAALKQRFLVFVDDNLTQDREHALELFRAIAPLRKRWVSQVAVDVAEDPELLAAMADSGCMGVFIGLESFDAEALAEQDKGFNAPSRYRDAVAAFHRHGMFVEAGVIVGFDTDGPDVFRCTLDGLDTIGIDAIQLAVFTPLPGTPAYEAMGDRIVDTNWEHYDYRHAVFEPKRMTRGELQAGADWLIRSFYSPWRIAARLPRWLRIRGGLRRFVYPLGLNLAYWGRVKRFAIRGYDPCARANRSTLRPGLVRKALQQRLGSLMLPLGREGIR